MSNEEGVVFFIVVLIVIYVSYKIMDKCDEKFGDMSPISFIVLFIFLGIIFSAFCK